MQAKKLDISAGELANPDAQIWQQVTSQKVSLMPAPVAMQPSKYIVDKWQDGDFGKVSELGVQTVHNGDEVAFRLEWQQDHPALTRTDNDEFLDAAAILFPLSENTSLMMGLKDAPVNIWYWRADQEDTAQNNVANGIGTSMVTEQGNIKISAHHQQGHWSVVFRRKLKTPELIASESSSRNDRAAQFAIGDTLKTAFAIWSGGNQERGGLKSFSPIWLEITLEA